MLRLVSNGTSSEDRNRGTRRREQKASKQQYTRSILKPNNWGGTTGPHLRNRGTSQGEVSDEETDKAEANHDGASE
ncbi:hypothetical protein V7x_56140 [Crateriforma conspicua]|uniref:Uncharacterized protein n=1 Tax=Crateriforma conspicua TaxID=2527996 RepID=A0A5C6FFI0_9PLAN|nr:hypothetical protein V7x_56140 [Crateriforma conspicua]